MSSQATRAMSSADSGMTAESLAKLRHDLRTCFNPILGYAEMIGEDAEDAEDQAMGLTVQARVQTLRASAGTMLEHLMRALNVDAVTATPDYLHTVAGQLLEKLGEVGRDTLLLRESLDGFPDATRNSLEAVERAAGMLHRQLTEMRGVDPDLTKTEETAVRDEVRGAAATEPDADGMVASGTDTVGRMPGQTVLIVDDQEENRALLTQRLRRDGFQTLTAGSGEEALRVLAAEPVDLVLLDILMDGMSGIEVLERTKADADLRAIPVIMLSSLSEIQSVVRCLEMGAEDYINKPFNSVLLRARIGVTLERRRLALEGEKQRADLHTMVAALAEERGKAHDLLLNILPEKVAQELQQGHSVPMYFEDTTIGFTDFVGFTLSTESMAAEHVVEELHTFFSAFDRVMDRYGVEKMKTIGDSYMFASGLPKRHPANPVNAVLAALELAHETEQMAERADAPGWTIRIGLHTGPVIAGVVGIRKFAFDIWGDSVNFASRMESSGAAGQINISERTYARVKDFFRCEARGKVTTKDGREVEMYFVRGVHAALLAGGSASAFTRRYKLYFGEEPPSFPRFLLAG